MQNLFHDLGITPPLPHNTVSIGENATRVGSFSLFAGTVALPGEFGVAVRLVDWVGSAAAAWLLLAGQAARGTTVNWLGGREY